MKKLFVYFLSIWLLVSGCSLFTPSTKQNTKNQDKIAKVVDNAAITKDNLSKSTDDKLNQTATFAYGVNYSLNQITNKTVPIMTALKLNGRIMSIVGSPDLDEMNKITQIVDLLNSEVAKEKEKGQKLLNNKDNEIILLQKENNNLKDKYEKQIADLIAKSKNIARDGDNAQATVKEMSGNFGLNAIWWGIKRFVATSLTTLLIVAVAFFALRAFAASNPIVGAVFSIFEMIGGGFISLIKGLTPKSINFSNLVHFDEHNKYKQTLDKIVDTIEKFKIKCEAGNKQCTLAELLDELDRKMDQADKDAIKDILKDQKWN